MILILTTQTIKTEGAEALSDMPDKLQWKFNSLGQNVAFSCFGWMGESTRMVQQFQVFLEVNGKAQLHKVQCQLCIGHLGKRFS